MLRSLLAERFKLVVRRSSQEMATFILEMARPDKRLGKHVASARRRRGFGPTLSDHRAPRAIGTEAGVSHRADERTRDRLNHSTNAGLSMAVHTHGGYHVHIASMGRWCFGLKPTDVWWATAPAEACDQPARILLAPLPNPRGTG
jgi:hypothetical protein